MLHWKIRGNLPELFWMEMNGSWGGMQGWVTAKPQPVPVEVVGNGYWLYSGNVGVRAPLSGVPFDSWVAGRNCPGEATV